MTLLPDASGLQQVSNVATERIELIWQMGFATLSETDNELRLPESVSESLNRSEIVLLENRLSEYLGAPVVSFKDLSMNTYRILRMPEMQKIAGSPTASMSPTLSSSSISSPSAKGSEFKPKTRQYVKKSKIPRPPNAFILYRQKHHPLLKAEKPELHNNQISVILGQQWKNESLSVRNKFKDMAEELKRQHLIKFPDYQYAPRKPSEKKRRMTARKLAALQAEQNSHDTSEFPVVDANGMYHNDGQAAVGTDHVVMHASFDNVPSLDDILELNKQYNDSTIPAVTTYESYNEDLADIFTAEQIAFLNQNTSTAPPSNDTSFLNSLVDWTALNQDITESDQGNANEDSAQVIQILEDHPWIKISSGMDKDAFDKELQRTLHMFE